MVDLSRGKFLGTQEDPVTGKQTDTAEAQDFMTCPACGGVIDLRDLTAVLAHLAPLPHPAQDGTN
jgi:hypothetical protein